MAPRSSWKGFIKLSLVSVPVKAYTANQSGAEVRLNQLHAECNNRIRYQKICPEHGEVASDEIVSGYEYSKGQYVLIDLDELSKLRPESDRSVTVRGFVAADEVPPLYHSGKTYYLVPDGAVGQKPYALLRQAMSEESTHAIAQIVLSGKEQLVLLKPLDNLLAMVVLNYASRVKRPESFDDEIVEQSLSADELKLTKTLIEASTLDDFDINEFSDVYTERLTQLIQSKVDGQELVAVPDAEEPKILNLMEALKKSVAQAQLEAVGEVAAPAKTRKKAASKKKATSKTTKRVAPSAAKRKAPTRKKKSG